jgi:site-specific DNA-methyltransferase (adenine-specific)
MTAETFLDGRVTLLCGDCIEIMAGLPECSIDAVVCDPPYHLQSITKRFAKTGRTDKTRTSSGPHQRTARGFMNKMWDGGNIAFRVETWEAVLRMLKPGAYLVAFSSTRTFGRMSVAIEDAGFIVHPFVAWVFAQGFPKAHKVHADEWEGWRYGTQSLKPAIEPIFVGQKPFETGLTGTQNVLKWGVGALNIDGCRIPCAEAQFARDGEDSREQRYTENGGTNFAAKPDMRRGRPARSNERSASGLTGEGGAVTYGKYAVRGSIAVGKTTEGRWPANLLLDGSDEVLATFPAVGDSHAPDNEGSVRANHVFGADNRPRDFHPGFVDSGSAARFFYTAKADSLDRLGSKHPTVKPVDLMQWLVRLVTPPRGTCLDPFAGTGTTAEAAYREGFNAVLIEREAEYQADIRRRMALVLAGPDERARESIKASGKTADPGPLFGGAVDEPPRVG